MEQNRFVHEKAEVHPSAVIGPGCAVWQFASVLMGARLGEHCSVGACAEVCRYAALGDRVRMGHGACVAPHAIVEDDVFIGPYAILIDDAKPKVNNPDYRPNPPTIRRGASIGAGAIIFPGVEVGPFARIGAGAIVTKDVKKREVVYPPKERLMICPA